MHRNSPQHRANARGAVHKTHDAISSPWRPTEAQTAEVTEQPNRWIQWLKREPRAGYAICAAAGVGLGILASRLFVGRGARD